MAAVREAVRQISPAFERLGDRIAHHRRAERYVAAGNALGHRHQVGLEIPHCRRKPIADAAESSDHLVGDEENVVLPAQRTERPQVSWRRDDDAARPLNPLRATSPEWGGALRASSTL